MARVIGIGGVFFKARDPKALAAWYKQHLGMDIQEAWGGMAFESHDPAKPEQVNQTIWSVGSADKPFGTSTASFMINYRVDDLHALLAQLRAAGCAVEDKVDDSEYGKFGWVMDPEGNRIELWQPPA